MRRFIRWRCDCGQETETEINSRTTSCGCLRLDAVRASTKTHGETGSRLWRSWFSMRQRCMQPNDSGYPDYGGRGISVCDEWRDDYIAFRDWAMVSGYTKTLTLDRIDVNGHYTPDNCRWADPKTQARNRRCVPKWEADGKSHCRGEWAEITGLSHGTISQRLKKGWSVADSVNTPWGYRCLVTAFGETKTRRQWIADPRCQVSIALLYDRLHRGWPPERAISTPPFPLGRPRGLGLHDLYDAPPHAACDGSGLKQTSDSLSDADLRQLFR